MGYFRILTAIPGFFLGALFLMLLWNVVGPQVGLGAISYPTAMLVNIALWLAVGMVLYFGYGHRRSLVLRMPKRELAAEAGVHRQMPSPGMPRRRSASLPVA